MWYIKASSYVINRADPGCVSIPSNKRRRHFETAQAQTQPNGICGMLSKVEHVYHHYDDLSSIFISMLLCFAFLRREN